MYHMDCVDVAQHKIVDMRGLGTFVTGLLFSSMNSACQDHDEMSKDRMPLDYVRQEPVSLEHSYIMRTSQFLRKYRDFVGQ